MVSYTLPQCVLLSTSCSNKMKMYNSIIHSLSEFERHILSTHTCKSTCTYMLIVFVWVDIYMYLFRHISHSQYLHILLHPTLSHILQYSHMTNTSHITIPTHGPAGSMLTVSMSPALLWGLRGCGSAGAVIWRETTGTGCVHTSPWLQISD